MDVYGAEGGVTRGGRQAPCMAHTRGGVLVQRGGAGGRYARRLCGVRGAVSVTRQILVASGKQAQPRCRGRCHNRGGTRAPLRALRGWPHLDVVPGQAGAELAVLVQGSQGLKGEVGAHGVGAVGHEGAEVVHLARLARVDDERGAAAKALGHEVVVHGARHEERAHRHVVLVDAAVREHLQRTAAAVTGRAAGPAAAEPLTCSVAKRHRAT